TSILGPAAIAWLLLIEIFGRNSTRITRWPPSRHGATLTSANRATTPTDATSANAHSGGLRAVTGGQGQCLAAQRELARDCLVCISIHDVWLEQRTLLPRLARSRLRRRPGRGHRPRRQPAPTRNSSQRTRTAASYPPCGRLSPGLAPAP